jgi:hypothetical protein
MIFKSARKERVQLTQLNWNAASKLENELATKTKPKNQTKNNKQQTHSHAPHVVVSLSDSLVNERGHLL